MSAAKIIGEKSNGRYTLKIRSSMLYPLIILVGDAQQNLTKWYRRRRPDAWALRVIGIDLQDNRLAPRELDVPDNDLITRLIPPHLHRHW